MILVHDNIRCQRIRWQYVVVVFHSKTFQRIEKYPATDKCHILTAVDTSLGVWSNVTNEREERLKDRTGCVVCRLMSRCVVRLECWVSLFVAATNEQRLACLLLVAHLFLLVDLVRNDTYRYNTSVGPPFVQFLSQAHLRLDCDFKKPSQAKPSHSPQSYHTFEYLAQVWVICSLVLSCLVFCCRPQEVFSTCVCVCVCPQCWTWTTSLA